MHGLIADYIIARVQVMAGKLRAEHAEASWKAIIGAIVLFAALWAGREYVFYFFQWMLNTFFDILHESFGTENDGPFVGGEDAPRNHGANPADTLRDEVRGK